MKDSMRNQGNTSAGRHRLLSSIIGTALLCLAGAAAVGAAPAPQQEDAIGDTRAALEKWVETKRLISDERRKFELGRELLTDRIDLARRRVESLREKISGARESIAAADKKRGELLERNEGLKADSLALTEAVGALEARTAALASKFPEPLRERIRPISQRLPETPKETKLSLSERFLNIVGILNAANKFNREITQTSEVRRLGDGTTVEVSVLYLGLGQAFYASPSGDQAGVGRPGPEGEWEWIERNDAAAEIALAIKIQAGEEPAAFVQLPTRIDS